jgi:hypothetical protein
MMALVDILYSMIVREEAAYSDLQKLFDCERIYHAGKYVGGRERRR